ncbi:AAA family ATPase [Chelatococcus asaccharovorans]|uniref:AAA family ATPase n=1 Tax=Chelatococcus asaccharovorans TaxID=28210 RepID=UPI0039770B69
MAGCWSPSATYRRPKPRNATTQCWKNRPSRRNLNQIASGKPGAVHAGDICIAGVGMREAPLRARQHLSYAPDESPIYPFLTGSDLLDFVCMAKKRPLDTYVVGLIDGFGLPPFMGVRFSNLSLGSQKKLLLCAAWIGEPDVIFLDEPSNGLDLASRDLLAELIRQRSRETTIFYVSHDRDFVAATEANVLTMKDLSLRVINRHPK